MKSLSDSQAAFLLAVARRVVPAVATLDPGGTERFWRLIDDALNIKPPAILARFKFFLLILRWAPALVFFRPLDRLGPGTQDGVLRWLQSSPIRLLRVGVWGLKTLCFMGYYGQPEVAAGIGYSPVLEGNERLVERP
ncbi:MAG: hypothetical protein HY897_17000 [Deltaproteobacteria bacterium]|nr:hypothetical protein [Deltaproteobacteria bacterium]